LVKKRGFDYLDSSHSDVVQLAADAQNLMRSYREGPFSHNRFVSGDEAMKYAFAGALLAEKIGRGKKAISPLLKAADYAAGRGKKVPYEKIKAFVERNSRERKEGGLIGKLKNKFFVFSLFTLGGIALSAFSLQSTGNAIGNLTGTTQGLLGILLFVIGLAGLVFSRKRYKK